MNFINVFVEGEYSIKVKNSSLVLEGKESHSYPLSDVGVVMLESLKSNISVYALNALVEAGATVFVCNDRHLPTAVLTASNDYYKPLHRYKLQTEVSKPRLKRLWREIIRSKISNQAECLSRAVGNVGKLIELCDAVKSGDSDNLEAQAAAYYFPKLFGRGFIRDSVDGVNAALNYAYSIVRGILCRQICARGFLPCLGIFHKNEYNGFNLADDLIEPFRPIVDYFVYTIKDELVYGLTPLVKRKLFSIVNLEVESGNERHSLAYAAEREVESVIAYYDGRDELLFPKLIGTAQHCYE